MIFRGMCIAAVFVSAALVASAAPPAARDTVPLPPAAPMEESVLVERGLLLVRLDPKFGVKPEVCDALAARDLEITVDGVAAEVIAVERVPRPERHWLLLDVSASAEGRRREAMRSAREYLAKVMTPELDSAAVLTVDDDTILVSGPSTDSSKLDASIAAISSGGGSALRDGLATVLRQVEGDRHEHLILYWTDGKDTSSVTTDDDVLAGLARARNATVFPLALLPTLDPPSRQGPIGNFLFDVARRSGTEVWASNDPLWLDRVRGWIGRRFTVAFTPPTNAGRRALRVAVRGRRCAATILEDPFAVPDAIAGEAPPAPRPWVRIHAKQRAGDDPACSTDRAAAPWDWPLRSEGDRLAGCVLDAVEAAGPVVRSGAKSLILERTEGRMAARDVRVVAPPIAELPHELVDAIPSLLSQTSGTENTRSPLIVEGAAFLAQRPRIAASLFAVRRDYRDFALARLARLADDDLREIESDFRRMFPDLADETIASIARASRAGQRVLDAVKSPNDADLARVLAAWLGDVPAWELFRAWEKRLVDNRLAGHGDPEAMVHWAKLRRLLGQPEHLRVAAPLILVHETVSDLVGFWRIVLPRPLGYYERAARRSTTSGRVEDRIPVRPLALDLVERALRREEFRERLADAAYHVVRIDYAPTRVGPKALEEDPFRNARVTLALEAPGRERVTLETEPE